MANISNIQCPWKNFYKQAIRCMNNLHIEACKPQMKVAKFIYAMRHNFASSTMKLTKESKKSTKQLQGSKKFKIMVKIQTTAQRTEHPTVTQTQHIVQSQKATIQHTFQDHPAVQNQQDNTYDHASTKVSRL